MVAATVPATPERKKIRVNGEHALPDVARVVCGDVRVTPLLCDLNPTLPSTGLLPAGTVVVCPHKAEAMAFAKKMGFTLGFDPKQSNGTGARRKWAEHVGGQVAAPAPVDALALARSLVSRGVTPPEAGKRLAKLVSVASLQTLASSSEPAIRLVAQHAEACALLPKAASRMASVRSVLDATVRKGGFRALLEGLARDPAGGASILQACAVAPALRQVLLDEAPRAVVALQKAKDIASLERGARDATLARDPAGKALRPIVDALVDGVEPLAPERLACVALADEGDALLKHLQMLLSALRQAERSLGRSSIDVLRAIANGLDGARLMRPWPLLAAVCRDLWSTMESVPATARDLGLGGLLVKKAMASTEGAPVGRLTVQELQVRAAVCARAVDEGEAFAERLAGTVVELFDLMRPPPAVDGGTPQARKARRRMAFDHAMAGKGKASAEGVASLVVDALERARLGGHTAALRLTKAQTSALELAAREMTVPMTIHRQPMSELGRALVVAAMALDREVGQGLMRPTGREAFVEAAMRHAGRVLSAASCRIR
jgi:hypothetical protein